MPFYDEIGATWDHPLIRFDDPRTLQEVLNDPTNTPKPMFDVVLELRGLSVPDLLTRLRAVSSATAAEPAFASLSPQITALNAKLDTLEARLTDQTTAANAATLATAALNSAEVEAIQSANILGAKIGETATTEAEVEATLLRVKRNDNTPRPVPNTPPAPELKIGDEEGELSGDSEGQPGIVDYYEIQTTTSNPAGDNPNWQLVETSKRSNFTLTGLPPGQVIWVRQRAVNTTGKSPWSPPAWKRVP